MAVESLIGNHDQFTRLNLTDEQQAKIAEIQKDVARKQWEVMDKCLQLHGGLGFMRESTIERMARDARVQSIGVGEDWIFVQLPAGVNPAGRPVHRIGSKEPRGDGRCES